MRYLDAKESHKRILASQALLLEETTSKEKFQHVRALLTGINPQLDSALERCAEGISTLDKLVKGDVLSLSAENLPENTEEEKKRKKAILFFVGSWNKLKSEVARVEKELASAEKSGTPGEKANAWRKIFNFAKGPLGLITIAAVGIVLTMQAVSVQIVIKNEGCGTLTPGAAIPFSMPGLSIPKEIANGGAAIATVPGLTITVDATQQGSIRAEALNYGMDFDLPSNVHDIHLDGESLLGKETIVRLSDMKEHELVLTCGR